MTEQEFEARRRIFAAFAATGAAPVVHDGPVLRSLAAQHVVVLDEPGAGEPRVRMAHPFAGHHDGTRVDAGGRTWWGSCAWDGLGIVAALGIRDATVTSNGIELAAREGRVAGDAVFHVAVAARAWWNDIGFT